jgi:hypothetical protein
MAGGVAMIAPATPGWRKVQAPEQFDLPEPVAYDWLFVVVVALRRNAVYMENRRRLIVLGTAVTLLALPSVTLVAQQKPPQQQQPPKLSDADKRELENINKLLDGIETSGQPAPNDFGVAWLRDDVIRVPGNKEYVPFLVSLDPSKSSAKNIYVYWRATPVNAAATPVATEGKSNERNNDRNKPAPTPFLYSMNTTSLPADGKLGRSFVLDPGTYDVHLVVKEPTSRERNAPPPKQSVVKHRLEVPNLWSSEFTTSSLLVGRIDPLPAPLTPQQQVDRPYALGAMEIVPNTDNKFTKKSEMSMLMVIYNAKTDAANMPDIVVEYNFHQKLADGEKFFNKTDPQNMNAQTLPPQATASNELQAGQSIPLASFPEGDYRLEIKITDKIANKTLTKEVNFSVAGS